MNGHIIGCMFAGGWTAQCQADFWLWESILNQHRFDRIMELGTGTGIFSCFLLMHCLHKDADFVTVNKYPNPHWGKLNNMRLIDRLQLAKHIWQFDIFTDRAIKQITNYIGKVGQTILYCDNGDKPKEVATFAPYLKTGDIIAVHDWGTEFKNKDIPDVINNAYHPIISQDPQSKTMFWVRN